MLPRAAIYMFARFPYFLVLAAALAACGNSKSAGKGDVDESQPPAIPTELGKADGAERLVATDVQSAHPYRNDATQTFAVSLADLPSCATTARLHFDVLRTEADYDFVTVEPAGQPAQSFDGDRDDTWTEWFDIRSDAVTVRLATDGSITRHGFEIDAIEWDGTPAGCPEVRFPPCGAGTVDLAKQPGTCECPAIPQCESIDNVEVVHGLSRGFHVSVKRAVGAKAFETRTGPADELITTEVGTVDTTRLAALVRRAAAKGLLQGAGYERPHGVLHRDEVTIKAGAYQVTFVAGEGGHDPAIVEIAAEIDALMNCDSGALACGSGFSCEAEGSCREAPGCVCPALYDPVCGGNGQTYSNGCAAACASIDVVHAGECGIAGDMCGTMLGLPCQDDRRCRYAEGTFEAPYPDASGTCVDRDYCDAPPDCAHLAHPAVPGQWACESNACAWRAGAVWKAVENGRFETAHPYANGTSVWKEVALPADAQMLRLSASTFRLERGYDFLEVWTWQGTAWQRVRRYTGTAGPTVADEVPGRFHYLRFVSDSSITDQGFVVDAEWR